MTYTCDWCGKQIKTEFVVMDTVRGLVFCDTPDFPDVGDSEETTPIRFRKEDGLLDMVVDMPTKALEENHALSYQLNKLPVGDYLVKLRVPVEQAAAFM